MKNLRIAEKKTGDLELDQSLETTVAKIYRQFERDFIEENFPNVFAWIEAFNIALSTYRAAPTPKGPSKAAHQLRKGPHPIFQTPVYRRPKLVIVGNNNSWFHESDHCKAQHNLRELIGGVPAVNSYLAHRTNFGRSLENIFGLGTDRYKGLNRMDLLESCVGINRLWLQVGAKGKPTWAPELVDIEEVVGDKDHLFRGQTFGEYCATKTRCLIEVIEPRLVVLLGVPARKLYENEKLPEGTKVVKARHPLMGGEALCASQIREKIESLSL